MPQGRDGRDGREDMTQTSAHAFPSPRPALSLLPRQDVPAFAIALADGRIAEATPEAAALGLGAGGEAHPDLVAVARELPHAGADAFGLARLALPGICAPRLFRYAAVMLDAGPAMLFADQRAFAQSGPPQRISFETDADDRLRRLSPHFAEALGARADAFLGRSFAALEAEGLLVSRGALAAALASGASFSDVAVEVPALGADDLPLELELGGIPVFDSTRRRRSLRGFGLLRVRSATAPVAAAVPAPHRPVENVVPLRGGNLSPQERSAFREIARTLASAIEEWPRPRLDAAEDEALAPAVPAAEAETALLDRLPVGLLVQQDGELAFGNHAFFALSGWPGLDALRAAGGPDRVLEREASGALSLVTQDGRRVPVDVRLVAAPFGGRPALVHVVRETDTEDAREARAVARREALDMVPWPVLLLEPEGTIRLANRAAGARLGAAPLELAGEAFCASVAPQDRAAATDAIGRAAEGAEELVLTLRNRLGRAFPARVGIGRAGADHQLLCVVLRESEPSAPPAGGHLPHDLAGPLATVLAFAERRGRDGAMPQEVRAALATLRASLSDGASAPAMAACDISAVVRGALAALAPGAWRRRIALRPDIDDALSVAGDPDRLGGMARAMLEQAVDASPAGGSVAVSLYREEGGQTCLQVRDGGPAQGRPPVPLHVREEAQEMGGAFDVEACATRGMIARLTLP